MTQINANPALCSESEKSSAGKRRRTAGSAAGPIAGRPSRAPLTPAERLQVQEMALVDGRSNSEIARLVGRDRGTIANVLKADDTAALREQLVSAQRAEAIQTLRSNAARMATNWVSAAHIAAGKGDHRPSRDLLLHTGVIAPVVPDHGPRVAVQINLNGGPEPLSMAVISATTRAGSELSPITPIISIGTEAQPVDQGTGGVGAKDAIDGSHLRRPIDSRNFSSSKSSSSECSADCGVQAVQREGSKE